MARRGGFGLWGKVSDHNVIGRREGVPGWEVQGLFHRWKAWKHSFGGNGTGTDVVGMSGSIEGEWPHSRWARRREST